MSDRFSQPSPLATLPAHQQAILWYMRNGAATTEIAWAMGLTVETIKRHKRELMARWNADSDHDLMLRLRRTQYDEERSPGEYLVDEVLSQLVGGEILGTFVSDKEWAGFTLRLPGPQVRRVWILSNENGDAAGWLHVD